MPNENIRKVYDALAKKYTKMAQPYEEFESMMTDENNRRKVYDALSSKYKNMAQSWDEFNSMLAPSPAAQPAQPAAQPEARGEQMQQPVQQPVQQQAEAPAAQPAAQPALDQQKIDTIAQSLMSGKAPRYVPSSPEEGQAVAERVQQMKSEADVKSDAARQWAEDNKEMLDETRQQMKEARKAKWQKLGEALMTGMSNPMPNPSMVMPGYQSAASQEDMEKTGAAFQEYAENKLVSETLDEALDYARAAENKGGLGQGFIDTATRPGTWDFGYSDIVKQSTLQNLVEKYEDGGQLSEQEEKILDMVALATYITENTQNGVGIGYNVGASLPQSLGFMASIALNPASGMGKAVMRRAMRKWGSRGMATLARGLGDMAEMAVATATSGGGRTVADALDRINGSTQYEISPEGLITYGGQAEQAELGEAMMKAFGNNFIENYTEAMGEYFAPLAGMLGNLTDKGLRRVGLGKMADFLHSIPESQWGKMIENFKRATKFDGIVGEILEEEIGMFMEPVFIGDSTLGENFNVWSKDPEIRERARDNQLTTILSCALMSGALYGVESAGARSRIDRNLRKADRQGKTELGAERWDNIKSRLENVDHEEIVRELKDIVYDTDLDNFEREAIINYAVHLLQTQEYNTTSERTRQEMTRTSQELLAAYDAGYRMAVQAEPRSFRQVNMSLLRAEWEADEAGILNEAQKLVDADEATREQVLQGLPAHQRQAVEYYLGCAERQRGLYDGVQLSADEQIDEATFNLAPAVYQAADGSRWVTSAQTADGRFVYVISQNGPMSIVIDMEGNKAPYPTDQLSDIVNANADEVEEQLRTVYTEQSLGRLRFYEAHNEQTEEPRVGMVIGDGDATIIVTDMGEGWATVQEAQQDSNGQWIAKPNGKSRDVTKEYLLALQDEIYDRRDMMDGKTPADPAAIVIGPTDEAVMQQRAAEWEAATGQKVRLITNMGDVDNPDAQAALAAGKNITGWYNDATGEVCFYMPNITDISEIDKTYIHEVVGHKGMRGLLGDEGYAALCSRVWNEMMTDADKAYYMSLVQHVEGDEAAHQLAAADEYIAYFAEQMSLNPTEENRTLWQQFVAMVRDILSRLGLGGELTDEDLSELLQASLARYRELNKIQQQQAVEAQQEEEQPTALQQIPAITDKDGEVVDYDWAKAPDVDTALQAMREAGYDEDVIRGYAEDMVKSLQDKVKKAEKPKASESMAQRQANKVKAQQYAEQIKFWQDMLDAFKRPEDEQQEQPAAEQPKEEEVLDAFESKFDPIWQALSKIIDDMDFATQVRFHAARPRAYIWADDEKTGTKGFASHMIATKGSKRGEMNANIGWLANKDKGGRYPEQMAHDIFADLPEHIKEGHDEMEAFEIVLSTIQSASSPATVIRQMYEDLIEKPRQQEQEWEENQQYSFAVSQGFASYEDYLTFEELLRSGEDIIPISEEEQDEYDNFIAQEYEREQNEGVLPAASAGVLAGQPGQETPGRQDEGDISENGEQGGSVGQGTGLDQGQTISDEAGGGEAEGSINKTPDTVPDTGGVQGTAAAVQGLEGRTEAEIKGLVEQHIKDVLPEGFKVTGIRIIGSRTTGTAKEGSDLDVLVQYEGDTSEDAAFNALNGEPLVIDGITVDINPIRPDKSGTIDEWIERNKDYKKEEKKPEKSKAQQAIEALEGEDEENDFPQETLTPVETIRVPGSNATSSEIYLYNTSDGKWRYNMSAWSDKNSMSSPATSNMTFDSREDALKDAINYAKFYRDKLDESGTPHKGLDEFIEYAEKQISGPEGPTLFRVSDKTDEKGHHFVLNSNGKEEFGIIDKESGLTSAPILLSEGEITDPDTKDGYGLVHIEAKHGDEIRNAGFDSVLDFIEDVAKNYETIREGNVRNKEQTYLLQLKDKHNNTLIVELSKDGDYWNINTAGVFRTSYGAKKDVVYTRHATDKQSTETVEASLSGEPGGTTPSTSMNAPTQTSDVSGVKDTQSSEKQNKKGGKSLFREANDILARYNEQDGSKQYPYMSERDLVEAVNESDRLMENKRIAGLVNEYFALMEIDRLEGNRDFAGGEMEVLVNEELIPELKKIAEQEDKEEKKGETRFREHEAIEDEKTEDVFKRAIKEYGTTSNSRLAGYMLPDGKYLDFSEGQGYRTVDHRNVGIAYENTADGGWKYMVDFMRRGAIRIKPESDGFELMVEPTPEQRRMLRQFIGARDGNVMVDIYDEKESETYSAEYEDAPVSMVLGEIDRYFRDGIKPQGNTMFREANANQAIFVSNAQRAVEGIKQEKGTPDQWLAMIQGKGGLKAGEDKWLNLSEWIKSMKEMGAKTLAKQEILEYIDANKIEIEEQWYGDINSEEALRDDIRESIGNGQSLDELQEEYDAILANADAEIAELSGQIETFEAQMAEKYGEKWDEKLNRTEQYRYDDMTYRRNELMNEPSEAAFHEMMSRYGDDFEIGYFVNGQGYLDYNIDPFEADEQATMIDGTRPLNSTRLRYTTEDLDNKREIALWVPGIEPWNQVDNVHFGDAGSGRAIGWIRFGEVKVGGQGERVYKTHDDFILAMQRKYDGKMGAVLRDAMTDEEKAIEDELLEGKQGLAANESKALVIDEIQSKRHQAGREKGYKGVNTENWYKVRDELEDYKSELKKKYGKSQIVEVLGLLTPDEGNKYDELVERYNNSFAEKDGIPDAPFDKNWPELCMKRMLRLAAEEGYSKLAWTDGETQAERYDIGQVVSSIERTPIVSDEADARYQIYDNEGWGRGVWVKDGVIGQAYWDEMVGKRLEEVFGKELAQKMTEMKEGDTLNQDDMRVGAEGMRGFYDRMLPQFMTKYGKQWGVKPELQEIPGLDGKWWTVDVNDEMKKSVMEGQTMFRIGNNKQTEALNEKQKQPGEDYRIEGDEIADIRFRLSRNNRKTIETWLKKRTDIDEAERQSTLAYIDGLDDGKLQLAAGWWFAKGSVRFPEDMPKVEQAVKVSTIAKVDPLKYSSPMELINAHADIQVKEKPINPDEVSTLHKVKELPDGIVIYDVDDTEESRQNMRKIIDTHYGKESSPWCLLQGDDNGGLTKNSREYWDYYNGYPKQVAFKNGKLLAFSANREKKRIWWDRMDSSHDGVPVTGKIPGDRLERNGIMLYNAKTGETEIEGRTWRGNPEDGPYEEFYDNSEQMLLRTTRKDGRGVGLVEAWHENGQKSAEFYNDEFGISDGPYTSWYDNGQVHTRGTLRAGRYIGKMETFYKDGVKHEIARYTDKFNPDKLYDQEMVGPHESWYPNGQKEFYTPYNKEGRIDGAEQTWYPTGIKSREKVYDNGYLKKDTRWYQNGGLQRIEEYGEDGRRNGIHERYHLTSDGSWLEVRYNYKNGLQDGLQEEFYENGTPYVRFNMEGGKKKGITERYYKNGQLWSRTNFDRYQRQDGVVEGWYDNGQLQFRREYSHGELNGVDEMWNKAGELISREYYKDGKKVEGPSDAEQLTLFREGRVNDAMNVLFGDNSQGSLFSPEEMKGGMKTAEPKQARKGKAEKAGPKAETIIPPLRKLEPGEICLVQRQMTEDKNFNFTVGNKIETLDDIAYIFKELEDKSVENCFVAFFGGECKEAVILHLSMGGVSGASVDMRNILPVLKAVKPSNACLVHNHPSGALVQSRQDDELLRHFNELITTFAPDVLVEPGIIIDTKSGKYATFYSNDKALKFDMPESREGEHGLKVYNFDKSVFEPGYTPEGFGKIRTSRDVYDVAAFISGQRLGEREKINILCLNNASGAVGNFFSDLVTVESVEDGKRLADQCAQYAGACGATAVVVYGTGINNRRKNFSSSADAGMRVFKARMQKSDIIVLEALSIDEDYNGYYSYADNGVFEPEINYGGTRFRQMEDRREGESPMQFVGRIRQEYLKDFNELTRTSIVSGEYPLSEDALKRVLGIPANEKISNIYKWFMDDFNNQNILGTQVTLQIGGKLSDYILIFARERFTSADTTYEAMVHENVHEIVNSTYAADEDRMVDAWEKWARNKGGEDEAEFDRLVSKFGRSEALVREVGRKIANGDYEGLREEFSLDETAKKNIEGVINTIRKDERREDNPGEQSDVSSRNDSGGSGVSEQSEEGSVRFREVTDKALLDKLEKGDKIKVYRAMQLIDGKLYPPMAAKVDGKLVEPTEIGKWYQADERPDLIKEGNKFNLNKGTGTSLNVRYNPYFHTSRSPLNDQFTSAYNRPNLVTVEVEVPASELTSGYKAEGAKDAVGEVAWHSGPVSGKLPADKERKVILSRWCKPLRIVPDSEVAEKIKEILDGENIPVPYNTVTPSLRDELEKAGVEIIDEPSGNVKQTAEKREMLEQAEAETDTNPTEGQKEAGNYKKGHVRLFGMDLSIENPKGSERSGVDADGKAWSQKMHNTYGYIRGTMGRDKDHIDFFLGDNINSERVYVVDQRNVKDDTFDEHKVMLGFDAIDDAREAYNSNYSKGWQGLSDITEVDLDDFKEWAFEEGRRTKPYSETAKAETRFREKRDYQQVEAVLGRDVTKYERDMDSSAVRWQEIVQDSLISVKKLQDTLAEATGQPIMDFENAYMLANQRSSRNKAQQEKFDYWFMRPLEKAIADIIGKGLSLRKYKDAMAELNNYLLAKHGLERNEVFARRDAKKEHEKQMKQNPNTAMAEDVLYLKNRETDYSGLTALTGETDVRQAEQKAQIMVDDYERNHDVAELWKRINAATKETLRIAYAQGGVLSEEKYAELTNMFKYYVPLRGFKETTSSDVYGYFGSVNSPYNTAIKKAVGRKSLADAPLATIGNIADSTIMEANQNIVHRAVLSMAESHHTRLLSVSEMMYHVETDPLTGQDEWVVSMPQFRGNETPEEVEQLWRAYKAQWIQNSLQEPDKYKLSHELHNIPYKVISKKALSQHQIIAYRGGVEYIVTINGNPRAVQALNGFNNPDRRIIEHIKSAKNFLATVYTQINPEFTVRNLQRDMDYATKVVAVKENAKYALNFEKNWGIAFARMADLLNKYNNGKLDDNVPIQKMFRLFIENGGETGYTRLRSVKEHSKLMDKELRDLTRFKGATITRKVVETLGKSVENMNRWAEGVTRFAAFMTSYEDNRSVIRCVQDAKDISVNFNRKGAGTSTLTDKDWEEMGFFLKTMAKFTDFGNNWLLFYNAGVQGVANQCGAVRNAPVKGAIMIGSMVGFGALKAMLCMGVLGGGGDDDDDKKRIEEYLNLPSYIRRNNYCFRAGDKWVTIPISIDLRGWYAIGELVMSAKYEDMEADEFARELVGCFTQLMPVDLMGNGSGGMFANFIPAVAKPFWEIHVNEDWTGMPIYKDSPYNQHDPEWTRTYKGTSPVLTTASRILSEATGGGIGRRGAVEVNPAKIEHLIYSWLGGPATFANRLYKTARALRGDEDMKQMRNYPFVNSFLREGDGRMQERNENDRFFKVKEYVDDIHNEEKRLRQMQAERLVTGWQYTEDDINEAKDRLNELYKSDEWNFVREWDAMNKVREKIRDAKTIEEGHAAVAKATQSIRQEISEISDESTRNSLLQDLDRANEASSGNDLEAALNAITVIMNDIYRAYRDKRREKRKEEKQGEDKSE